MSGYRITTLDEIDVLDDGRCPMRPVRRHLGITSFGATAWTAQNAGDRVINEHDEADVNHEELYVVLNGHARFEIDGETVDAPAGTYVYVEPEPTRTAFAEEAGTTILVVGGVRGEVYRPIGWETWMPLGQLFNEGRYDEVVERGNALLAEDRDPPAGLLYNIACAESLSGRKAEAIAHLRQAFEADPSTRRFMDGDTDLDPLRDEPEFQALVGG